MKTAYLISLGLALVAGVGLSSKLRTEASSLVCYIEDTDGNVVSLEHICRVEEGEMTEDSGSGDVQGYVLRSTKVGTYKEGDSMPDGSKFLRISRDFTEILYPTGVRKIRNNEDGSAKFILSDGNEAGPGDRVKLFDDEPSFRIYDPSNPSDLF